MICKKDVRRGGKCCCQGAVGGADAGAVKPPAPQQQAEPSAEVIKLRNKARALKGHFTRALTKLERALLYLDKTPSPFTTASVEQLFAALEERQQLVCDVYEELMLLEEPAAWEAKINDVERILDTYRKTCSDKISKAKVASIQPLTATPAYSAMAGRVKVNETQKPKVLSKTRP